VYAFSTRADFLGFVQYQNEERRADFNLRFHWIPMIVSPVEHRIPRRAGVAAW
jgi:hypothetical protein